MRGNPKSFSPNTKLQDRLDTMPSEQPLKRKRLTQTSHWIEVIASRSLYYRAEMVGHRNMVRARDLVNPRSNANKRLNTR